jgi:hypothetical protein
MRRAFLAILFAGLVYGASSNQADARKPYFDGFKEKYGEDKQFAPLIEDAKCFICHVGKSKKNRNAYGMALSKALTKNEKDKEKIQEALGKVEADKAPDGETFGELIKDHKLPGGPPKKED